MILRLPTSSKLLNILSGVQEWLKIIAFLNGTWALIPRHSHMNVIGFKLVFHIKCKDDGTLDRTKHVLLQRATINERTLG